MHSNANLLPLHRSSSNEDYRYGIFLTSIIFFKRHLLFQIITILLLVVDLLQLLEHLHMTCKVKSIEYLQIISFIYLLAGNNHLMSPLQVPSATYNPMTGATAAASQYGHPYGSVPHQSPSMHGLPPNHGGGAHMHGVHPQAQSQSANPHMMSVQNGPVILVSNLNEDVSSKWRAKKREFEILVFLPMIR